MQQTETGAPRTQATAAVVGKKVYVHSLGCVENALLSSRLIAFFEENRWVLVSSPEEADLILVNTCGMSAEREKDSLDAIEKLRAAHSDPNTIIVTGCLAAINPESLKKASPDTINVSPRDLSPIEQLVDSPIKIADVSAHEIPEQYLRTRLRYLNHVSRLFQGLRRARIPYPSYFDRVLSAFEEEGWYYVHVSTGCVYKCAYCAIRFAKGPVCSVAHDRIVAEVRRGVIEQGHRRVVLVADDTGSYGLDRGTNLAELLCELVKIPGDFGIHVRNLQPMGLLKMVDGLEQAVRSGKIRAITVPLQSGSERILRLMRRYHRLDEILDALRRLQRANPELLVLTHVMVGFPGETRADFDKTLELIREFPFDGVAPDCFSPRERTTAAKMDGQLPGHVRRLRYWRTISEIVLRLYLDPRRWLSGHGASAEPG